MASRAEITYRTLEKIRVKRPVDRLEAVADLCRDRRVLDIGCLDETALVKRDTDHWLHGRIGLVAHSVIGVDNSSLLPPDGLETGPKSRIYRGDGIDPRLLQLDDGAIDVIVAGEFIEHLPSPTAFLDNMKRRFPGRELVLTTPNGACFANAMLGVIGREAQHHDHLMVSTYKTLHTLCRRAGFRNWEIRPYRFYATELALQSGPLMRGLIRGVEAGIRIVERLFPLRSFGYLVRIDI